MKKLLYLANLRLPTQKAYGIQIAKTCEAFARSSIRVHLVFPYRSNPTIKDDFFGYYSVERIFKVKRIPSLDFYLWGKMDKLTVHIKGFLSSIALVAYSLFVKADIVYSRDELVVFMLSFLKKPNKIIFEAHKFSDARKIFYNRFKKTNLKIVTITENLRKDFIKFGFRENIILTAPDGVDVEEFDLNISKEEAREKVGLPLDKKIIMYTGHLFDWKGGHVLAKAPQISQECISVFVGGMRHDVKEFKNKYKDRDSLIIVGEKPHKEIPVYLKAADILVLPNSGKEEISRKYTSPLKLFEYMASKRPIIASDLPSLREVLNSKNSFMFEADNPQSLADKVKYVLSEEDKGLQVAEEAFKDVQHYTWDKRVSKILPFIN